MEAREDEILQSVWTAVPEVALDLDVVLPWRNARVERFERFPDHLRLLMTYRRPRAVLSLLSDPEKAGAEGKLHALSRDLIPDVEIRVEGRDSPLRMMLQATSGVLAVTAHVYFKLEPQDQAKTAQLHTTTGIVSLPAS